MNIITPNSTYFRREEGQEHIGPADWQEKIANFCRYPLILACGDIVDVKKDVPVIAEKVNFVARALFAVLALVLFPVTLLGIWAVKSSASHTAACESAEKVLFNIPNLLKQLGQGITPDKAMVMNRLNAIVDSPDDEFANTLLQLGDKYPDPEVSTLIRQIVLKDAEACRQVGSTLVVNVEELAPTKTNRWKPLQQLLDQVETVVFSEGASVIPAKHLKPALMQHFKPAPKNLCQVHTIDGQQVNGLDAFVIKNTAGNLVDVSPEHFQVIMDVYHTREVPENLDVGALTPAITAMGLLDAMPEGFWPDTNE